LNAVKSFNKSFFLVVADFMIKTDNNLVNYNSDSIIQITFKLDFFSLYVNPQKDYTAWTSYDKNNFLLLFLDILFLDRV
jgi:hypothetical protein